MGSFGVSVRASTHVEMRFFYLLADAGRIEEEEKTKLLFQLQEKSSEVARLEKQVAELGSQRLSLLVKEGSSSEREQLQVRTQETGGETVKKTVEFHPDNS